MRYRIIKILIFLLFTLSLNLFSQVSDTTQPDTSDVEIDWEESYLRYEGMIIRKIYLRPIDVSGPEVDEKNGQDTSWFGNLANSMHFKTRDWVIKNWLLFSEGDKLEAKLITESERLLRLSGFFLDARINVIQSVNDSVDVFVTTKDRWTLTLNLSYNAEGASYIGPKDDNLLGMGQSIDASLTHSTDVREGLGGKVNYTIHNIAGYFINGGLDFQVNKKFNRQAIGLSRPFISTELDWAGGIEFKRENNSLLYNFGETSIYLPQKIHNYDVWIGRSFPVWFGDKLFRDKTRFVISGRVNKLEHKEKPPDSIGLKDLFTNTILYLAKGGIINRRYYKDYYIEGFGHTEDVPIGGILAVTFGTDTRETVSRIYTGIRGILSKRFQHFGYLSLLADFGAFRKGSLSEQKVFNFNFLYHSPLFEIDKWNYRFFVQGDYLLGFRRFQGEQIYLNEDTGIRGLEGLSIFGSKRGVLNLETRIFTPYSILGFVIGTNLYADFGLITGEGKSLAESKLYQGYGAGLRVSNESIARAQFSLGFVYNPFQPGKSSGSFSLVLSGSYVIGIRNFEFLRPYVIDFKENN